MPRHRFGESPGSGEGLVRGWKKARKERGHRGFGIRRLRNVIAHHHRLTGQRIEIRRGGPVVAVDTQVVCPQSIDRYQDDVGRLPAVSQPEGRTSRAAKKPEGHRSRAHQEDASPGDFVAHVSSENGDHESPQEQPAAQGDDATAGGVLQDNPGAAGGDRLCRHTENPKPSASFSISAPGSVARRTIEQPIESSIRAGQAVGS